MQISAKSTGQPPQILLLMNVVTVYGVLGIHSQRTRPFVKAEIDCSRVAAAAVAAAVRQVTRTDVLPRVG